jgi:hypothetical protein
MDIYITKEIHDSLNRLPGNKTAQKSYLKVYAALYLLSQYKNKQGYFTAPSSYLKKINSRYLKVVKHLINEGLLIFKTTLHNGDTLFSADIEKKYYSVSNGIPMSYKFLTNFSEKYKIKVDMRSGKERRWYALIEQSLIQVGLPVKITRDGFGRRVHHSGIRNYKKLFGRKGYCTIDAIASQPRILYDILKSKNKTDITYFTIFEQNLDFYNELSFRLNLSTRDEAKKIFLHWLNGDGFIPDFRINSLFPVATRFLQTYKRQNGYTAIARLIQREESKTWIDGILNHIDVDFALPVHDSLIIKNDDAAKVVKFISDNYPYLSIKQTPL